MLARLGRALARRAWAVLAVWAVLAAAGYFAAMTGLFVGDNLFDRLTTGEPSVPSESQEGREILDEVSPSGSAISLILDGVDPESPQLAQTLAEARTDISAIQGVEAVLDPSVAGSAFVATDGAGVLVTVQFDPEASDAVEAAAIEDATARLEVIDDEIPGSSGTVTGVPVLVDAITGQVKDDLVIGELIALPLSLLVMVVIFGGLAAAGVPLIAALASIAGGLSSLLGLTYLLDVDASVVNVITVLGLGLSIDYSLLVVSRYREELRAFGASVGVVPNQAQRENAAARTLATAGRTVLFSTITVAISVSGLMFFDIDVIRAIGAAAASVVLVALLASITLVPAVAVLASRWIARPGIVRRVPGLRWIGARLGDVAPEEGVFSRLTTWVQRRPVLVTLAATGVLVLLAVPSLRMDLRSSGAELLPPGAPAREAFTELQERFPAGALAPITVLAEAPPEQVVAYANDVAAIDGVTEVSQPEVVGEGYVVLRIDVAGPDQGSTAQQVVRDLRADRPDYPTWVTGQAAGLVDLKDGIRAGVPWALGVVIAATFVLLFLMTGSLFIPLKALIMSVLSLGATFGAMVWIFQDGRLEGVLGFASVGGLESFIPPLVFAFAFGLAMDYEVFLLSRIKEFHDAGMDNEEAVRAGLQRTGRIITAAALIIALVFLGFVFGDLLVIKQVGIALAFAVLIDATIVRVLLVPATMTIVGEWNWWAPGPLRRLHQRLGISEHAPVEAGGRHVAEGVRETVPEDATSGRGPGGRHRAG